MSRLAPTVAPAGPSIGWMFGLSLWLLPVLLGGGTTTWIGFGIIGLALLKRVWLVWAGIYAVLSLMVTVASGTLFADGLQIALIVVGTIHALVANRHWLITLWGRKERGVGMLGRGRPPTAATPIIAPPTAPPPSIPVPAASSAEPTYGELLESGMLSVTDDPSLEAVDITPLAAPAVPPTAPDTQWRPSSPNIAAPVTSVPSSVLNSAPFTDLRLTQIPLSSTVLPPREAVDPMTASLEALSAIPAIGPERAARIVAARANFPLGSLQAVADAAGLQGFELVRIRPFLRFPLG